jgi:dihydrofolate reductase
MAKLIYVSNVSLDGYIEDEHGSFDWTAPDDELFAFITDLVRPVGTYLYGRRLYDTMAPWETDPALSAQSELMADSPTSGRQRTRSFTPRPWTPCRPRRPGSSATSTPPRYAT